MSEPDAASLAAGREAQLLRVANGWSRDFVAALLGIRETTLRRMEAGKRRVPPPVTAWLRDRLALHVANPPPASWVDDE